MLTRAQVVTLKVAFVVGGSIAGFVLCETWYRTVEASVTVRLVRRIAGHGAAAVTTAGTSIAVFPHHGPTFIAIITPSCSATASILAIACLAALAPRFGRLRRLFATAVALLAVAAGNIVRISLSVLAGVHAGISSLVLFHDWVGGVMTFVYTLGGYVLFLFILLPDRRKAAAREHQEAVVAAK
jgi:exosortase/archaeosortase family protein